MLDGGYTLKSDSSWPQSDAAEFYLALLDALAKDLGVPGVFASYNVGDDQARVPSRACRVSRPMWRSSARCPYSVALL